MKKSVLTQKRRGRPRKFDRGEALQAAMLRFWRYGFTGTSISDLSEAMGINAPSLYGAFGDKKALFEETIEAYQKGPGCFSQQILNEEPDARRAIEMLLMTAAREFTGKKHPPGCMVVLSALNCTDEDDDVRQSLSRRRNRAAALIIRRIGEAHAQGRLPQHLAPDAFANLIVTVFQGLSVRARDGASREELEAVARQTMSLWPA